MRSADRAWSGAMAADAAWQRLRPVGPAEAVGCHDAQHGACAEASDKSLAQAFKLYTTLVVYLWVARISKFWRSRGARDKNHPRPHREPAALAKPFAQGMR
jgi:hypothetical protein